MKEDLDRLLEERGLNALVVVGPDGVAESNAPFRYFVGDAHLVGMIVKPRGRPAMVIYGDMERDAARATGLEPVPVSRWPLKEIFESFATQTEARIELYRRIFQDLGVSGRVVVSGVDDVNAALTFWDGLREALPGLEVVRERDGTLLDAARATKDVHELAALEDVAAATCTVVEEVRALLARTPVRDGGLADEQGPLTIGRVRAFANERLQASGLQATEGFILSANRDAGVPHTMGDDTHALALGDVLLFDFWPRGKSGFYHDVTRTWSIGPPRPEVRAVFEDVRDCFEHMLGRVRPGVSTRALQLETCAFFEARGHSTMRRDPTVQSGYVHSLGHGLGLEVHERPYFPSFRAGKDMTLAPGMVVTVEPGLYYPERGLGVRIEDTVVVTESGARSLTTVSRELELPRARESGRAKV